MDGIQSLTGPPGWGTLVMRAMVLLVGAGGVLVGAAVTVTAINSPVTMLIAALLLAVLMLGARILWRVGVFASDEDLVVRGVLGRASVPWTRIETARVDSVTLGFRPQRAVVIAMTDGEEMALYLWNERSLLMRGSRGGVDALAGSICDAIARHRE